MIRMLIIGYCYGVRSGQLCEEALLNIYSWICHLI